MDNKTLSVDIEAFEDLGNNISFYEPASNFDTTCAPAPPPKRHHAPRLIVMCTWLGGATTRRICKYTTRYQQLFPNASILLIRTTLPDITLRTFPLIRARLAPARETIWKVVGRGERSRSEDSVLLHLFSHGGCNTALQLLISMQQDGTPLPVKEVILDGCPGDETFQKAYDGAAVSLPAFLPVQMIGRAFLYPAIGVLTGLQYMGVISSVKDLRRELNDSTLLGSQVRRLYLYSAADRLVLSQDVQSHMEAARKLNYQVDSVMFKTAQHCSLIMEDDAKYWAAIETFWQGKGTSDLEARTASRLLETHTYAANTSSLAMAKL